MRGLTGLLLFIVIVFTVPSRDFECPRNRKFYICRALQCIAEVIAMLAGRPHKCPYCGGTETAGKGARKTKTMGIREIWRCKGCGRKFTPRDQQSVQPENQESIQPEPSEPITPCTPVPVTPETPTSIESEWPNHEHQSPGP
jgi:hypothetical protein